MLPTLLIVLAKAIQAPARRFGSREAFNIMSTKDFINSTGYFVPTTNGVPPVKDGGGGLAGGADVATIQEFLLQRVEGLHYYWQTRLCKAQKQEGTHVRRHEKAYEFGDLDLPAQNDCHGIARIQKSSIKSSLLIRIGWETVGFVPQTVDIDIFQGTRRVKAANWK
jgi:hypothetical protein